MKNILVYKIISAISLFLALVFFYEFFKELASGTSIFEIDIMALIVSFFAAINTIISILYLTKYLKLNSIILIFQILIITLTGWALYEIYSFEGPVIIDSQTIS